MSRWGTRDVPDQTGRRVIVTGANSGIGAVAARVLAERGADVVLACRNTDKGEAAAQRMTGAVAVRRLDLADLGSVRAFAAGTDGDVDLLINNAGVMAIPEQRTADGFEMQLGTNFLGHFALTGLLLPQVTGRVVSLSSIAHRRGRIDLDDLNWQRRRYRRWPAYGQSKLADLMFAYELARRLEAADSPIVAAAAHPGVAATELIANTRMPGAGVFGALAGRTVLQSAGQGALPTLYAATSPDVVNGGYYGPDGPGEVRGYPKPVGSSRASRDEQVAAQLWDRAAELTGVSFG